MIKEVTRCRISGSPNLVPVLDLGRQKLTGVFPAERGSSVTEGPLEVAWCPSSGLLQLRHSYNPAEMYGMNYGYRSGLNASMVSHLTSKARDLQRRRPLVAGDLVVDLGSNDGTLLKAFADRGLRRIGVDPVGAKFRRFYTDGIELVPDFFSSATFREHYGDRRAAIVTSIAMFYDLESPLDFIRDVVEILRDDGIWHFEQSYMPSMLRANAYDTICHEHLAYYALGPVLWLLEQCGLEAIDVETNAVNGGSFAVTAAKKGSGFAGNPAAIEHLVAQEEQLGLHTPRPFQQFAARVFEHRDGLRRLVRDLRADGKRVLGYGASTKGNVLLQFCGFTDRDILAIADVNPDKHGCYCPGTDIPIVSEREARTMEPDYYLVLPWHFKNTIVEREQEYFAAGGRMIFPLPDIEIVGE